MLSLRRIKVAFARVDERIQVLDEFSLTVTDGEFVALAERSVSGKPTAIDVAFGRGVAGLREVLWGSQTTNRRRTPFTTCVCKGEACEEHDIEKYCICDA